MSFNESHLFERPLAQANDWIRDLSLELEWENEYQVYLVLKGTLQAVRDGLHFEQALDLGSRIPVLIAAIYYDGWRPGAIPAAYRDKSEFLDKVAYLLPGVSESELEAAVFFVLRFAARRIPSAELREEFFRLSKKLGLSADPLRRAG